MPVGAVGHIRAKSLYVNSSILSKILRTSIVSYMPQLTTIQRISLPNVVNGTMVYDKDFDDLFTFKKNVWTSLTVAIFDGNSIVEITNETPSVSTNTGALIVSGGVGIGGSINIGGALDVSESITVGDDSQSIDELSGALVVSGGVGIGGSVNIGSNMSVIGSLNLGDGTSSYTFPLEKGNDGEFLRLENGELTFSPIDVENNVTAEFPFTADDRVVKTKNTGIVETGLSINSSNDLSGINNLTIGLNTTYTFPTSPGTNGQFLMQSTGGSLVFTTTSFSPTVVNAPITFGTDNVLLRSDGTGRHVQSTGITLSDNNEMTITGTTESTNISTGALKVLGGVAISKNLNVSGDFRLGIGTNSYVFPANIGNSGQAIIVSTTSGELTFSEVDLTNTVDAVFPFTGDDKIVKTRGTGIIETGININSSNDMTGINSLSISGTSSSVSSTTGSLIVSGGVGIGENLNVSRNITFDGRLTGRVRDVILDTILDDDYILNVAPGTSGAIITLPNIQNHIYTGVTYMVIKENANTVTITTDNPVDKITSGGSEVTMLVLTGLSDERITLVSNGKKWVTM